jgi:hypothetical protein
VLAGVDELVVLETRRLPRREPLAPKGPDTIVADVDRIEAKLGGGHPRRNRRARAPRKATHQLDVLLRHRPPSISFDLRSANGEPVAEPPRRKLVGYAPLPEMSDYQRRDFHEALLDADSYEDLPGKVAGSDPRGPEQNRPKLRLVSDP